MSIFSLAHHAVGRPFCKNFSIPVTASRHFRKKSDWFRCKKISQKLKYLSFKCEQSERFFIGFTTTAHAQCKKFAGGRRKVCVEIKLYAVTIIRTQGSLSVHQIPTSFAIVLTFINVGQLLVSHVLTGFFAKVEEI